jgi:hypothetical protein
MPQRLAENTLMGKASEFVASDPQRAMGTFNANLRRALKVSPAKLDALVEQDNAQREARRAESGQAKRGPKPRA